MSLAPMLTIQKDGEVITSVEVKNDMILGRAEGCVIRLDDRAVSRQHAIFKLSESGGISVSKQSEFGELKINGAEVTSAMVKEGDVIHIGPYLIRLQQAKKEKTIPMAPPAVEPDFEAATPSMSLVQEPAADDSSPPDFSEDAPAAALSANFSSNLDAPNGDATMKIDSLGLDDGMSPNPTVGDAPPTGGMANVEPANVDLNAMTAPEAQTDLANHSPDDETKVLSDLNLKVALVLSEGVANVTEYLINKDEVVIGRSRKEGCDIILNDKKASKRHAIIRRRGPHYLIKNLSDTNGTFVNGVKIDEQELSGEDVIKIADAEIKFKAEDAQYAEKEGQFLQVPQEEMPMVPVTMDQPMPSMGAQDPGLQELPGFQVPPPSYQPQEFELKKPQPTSLLEKFKAMPPARRILWIGLVGALLFFLLDEEPKPAPKPAAPVSSKSAPKGVLTYEDLTPDQKRFVETQHTLAFDHYKNRDYDKSLYEVRKIFTLINDYKDSREIERYALEGKQKLQALDDEKKKKEEEEALKQKVALMVEEADKFMKAKNYARAKEIFSEIRMLDPENPKVAQWIKDMEAYDEELRQKEITKSTERDNNQRTWDRLNEGMALKKKGLYYAAIDVFKTIPDFKASDTRVEQKAKQMIGQSYAALKAGREPLLVEARQLEEAGDLAKAFQAYRRASKADPRHPDAYQGMDRIRGVLHDRAKVLYTEAVLAESYSDFALAKKRFQEILEVAPEEDLYHGRAKRKLKIYVGQKFDSEGG